MAAIRTMERRIVNGRVVEVEVERDAEMDQYTRRFEVANKVQKDLGFHLDSAAASTAGKGKHTGNMAKANAAKGYVGACSRKTWRERQRAAAQRKLTRESLKAV